MSEYVDLEFSAAEMQKMGELAVKAVVEHIASLPDSPRSNLDEAEALVRQLREDPPEHGEPFEKLLHLLMNKIIPVSVNTAHPSYMAYVPGGGVYPSAVADFIASATNRFLGVWFTAPAASRLEANVLEWFARWMDYPDSARGILTTGGSLANFSAIVTARKALLGDNIAKGTLYMSSQTHHSVIKAALLAGIPQQNIRLLPVDSRFKAIPEKFESAIREDLKRGLRPFMIVANAGTTNTGSVDPLADLAEISRRFELWYHIDGAYGGFFRITPEKHNLLRDIALSDSVVLDPHKGLFVPYGTGSLIVKVGEKLRQAHMLPAEYLQDHQVPENEVNPADHSPELSRSYRGLRVWLPIKLYGMKAIRSNLQEKLHLTRWLYAQLQNMPGFECFNEPELTVVTFRYRAHSADVNETNRRLLQAINQSKKLFMSSTRLNGDFVLRLCVLSFRTHRKEVEEALEVIGHFARRL